MNTRNGGRLASFLFASFTCCGGGGGLPPTIPEPVLTSEPDTLATSTQVSIYSTPSPYSESYTEGMWIRLTAEFNEHVRVSGNPRLAVSIGEDTRYADATPDDAFRYSGPDHRGRQDTLLRFDYLIRDDDSDRDGISIGADAFDFSEGMIIWSATNSRLDVEITSIVPSEIVPSYQGNNPRRTWSSAREPGTDILEHPVMGRPSPRSCGDELERARGRHPILVEEWNGTPFRFYFSRTGTPDAMRSDADRVLETARRLSERIKNQIGYAIFEVAGLLDTPTGYPLDDDDCSWRESGQIIAMYYATTQSNYRCATWAGNLDFSNGSVAHSTFHIFGFDHSPNDWRGEHDYWKGNWMSRRLTGVYVDDEDLGVTFEDVDALRCIFPQTGPIQ